MRPVYTTDDFAQSPFIAFYEVTRACDLACKHCRACAQPRSHRNELDTASSIALIDRFASFPKPPLLVFTGGDPLKRGDIFDLVAHARSRGLVTAMTPSATPLVTGDALCRLRDMGLHRLALSLDAPDAATHDAFRGVAGSFDRTLEILHDAKRIGLSLQVNTTVTRRNVGRLDRLADLLGELGIVLWSVFYLVPVGRGLAEQRIGVDQVEQSFETLYRHSRQQPYAIKTTEAHHYRRFVMQNRGDPQRDPEHESSARVPLGINDGRGVMFVSHIGQVFPSGFMPIDCGRFPRESIVDIYQNHPTFVALRDKSRLKGKCGRCEFREVCGGSRARAYALTGDIHAPEPDCNYIPKAMREELVPC